MSESVDYDRVLDRRWYGRIPTDRDVATITCGLFSIDANLQRRCAKALFESHSHRFDSVRPMAQAVVQEWVTEYQENQGLDWAPWQITSLLDCLRNMRGGELECDCTITLVTQIAGSGLPNWPPYENRALRCTALNSVYTLARHGCEQARKLIHQLAEDDDPTVAQNARSFRAAW